MAQSGSEYGELASSCEHGDKTSRLINREEFSGQYKRLLLPSEKKIPSMDLLRSKFSDSRYQLTIISLPIFLGFCWAMANIQHHVSMLP
jgi:hypothetical protein